MYHVVVRHGERQENGKKLFREIPKIFFKEAKLGFCTQLRLKKKGFFGFYKATFFAIF